ncbi:hypothetical protein [Chryseolinea lacunae]|uniref:Prevent-host-death protein n=1 Tax=Chryseolinea lacunae TaxID=2801331 RepID=A0ABS1KKG8_9BACT|nr:hypothetical protein [Chryseolinea lacunae]MBL0739819.1 hypothetical protein [Chryseolinea lacunae]
MKTIANKQTIRANAPQQYLTQQETDRITSNREMIKKHEEAKAFFKDVNLSKFLEEAKAHEQVMGRK